MTKPSREEYEDVAYIIDNGGTLTGRGRQVAAAALRIAAEQVGERENVVAVTRLEVMRLMREDFDPTPNGWEGRDWHDNAEDTADKIIATVLSESPPHVSDSWRAIKQWLSDYAAEEAAFSHYSDDVLLDGVMTAGTMRALNDALYVAAEAEHRRLERGDHSIATPVSGWRSMDSAPRDGSRFLWAGDNGEYAKERWTYALIFWPEYADCFDAGVWQPLPSPPGGGT